jgi:hypothetical protein
MRNLMLSAVSVAALAIVATDARPAAAQEVVSGSSLSSPGYYVAPAYYGGNYTPVYRGAYSSGSRTYSGYSYPGNSYSGISRAAYYGGSANYRSYSGVSYGGRSFDSRRR